jgi:hypothetical protein
MIYNREYFWGPKKSSRVGGCNREAGAAPSPSRRARCP